MLGALTALYPLFCTSCSLRRASRAVVYGEGKPFPPMVSEEGLGTLNPFNAENSSRRNMSGRCCCSSREQEDEGCTPMMSRFEREREVLRALGLRGVSIMEEPWVRDEVDAVDGPTLNIEKLGIV